MPCKPIAKRCKTEAEAISIGFNLTDFCVNRAARREVYGLGETTRPPAELETGYEYECSTAGMTGPNEPNWDQATVNDGSVVWTRQPISNASLARTIGAVTWDGDTLTISDEQEVTTGGEQQIACIASAGTEGRRFPKATVEFSDGQEREYSQQIEIT